MFKSLVRKIIKLILKPLRPVVVFVNNKFQSYRLSQPDNIYNSWAYSQEQRCYVESSIQNDPLISIVVPIYNPPEKYLLEMVYSVVNQHYQNWELILVNASTQHESKAQVEECSQIDTRIKVVDLDKNEGIASNTNRGLEQANGKYVAFLDHDDVLHPCALHCVVEALGRSSSPDLIYTDEDKITQNGERYFQPLYKPVWSPDLFRNVNYINHLTVVLTSMVNKVGGLRADYDGAQDYDLLLRIIDVCKPQIYHVPKVLYHWRAAETSTANDIKNKDYIFASGEQAITDHLHRNKIPAKVSHIDGKPGFYRLSYKKTDFTLVIGPVEVYKRAACVAWIDQLLETLCKQPKDQQVSFELVIGSWFKKFKPSDDTNNVRTVLVDDSSFYWQEAVSKVTKPVIIAFKVAALPENPNHLYQLAAVAAGSDETFIEPMLIDKGGSIVDAGVSGSGFGNKFLDGYSFGQDSYFGTTDWVRNPISVTTNVLAASTASFKSYIDKDKNKYDSALISNKANSDKNDTNFKFILWSHSKFNYLGRFNSNYQEAIESIEAIRFKPKRPTRIDDWAKKYERDEK